MIVPQVNFTHKPGEREPAERFTPSEAIIFWFSGNCRGDEEVVGVRAGVRLGIRIYWRPPIKNYSDIALLRQRKWSKCILGHLFSCI
jgi:hypothetical protein